MGKATTNLSPRLVVLPWARVNSGKATPKCHPTLSCALACPGRARANRTATKTTPLQRFNNDAEMFLIAFYFSYSVLSIMLAMHSFAQRSKVSDAGDTEAAAIVI